MRKSAIYTILLACCSLFGDRLFAQDTAPKTTPTEAPKPQQPVATPKPQQPVVTPTTTTPQPTAQASATSTPTQNTPGAAVGNPTLTVAPIILPLEAPPPVRRRRRVVVDSLAIAIAQLDSSIHAISTRLVRDIKDSTSIQPKPIIPVQTPTVAITPPVNAPKPPDTLANPKPNMAAQSANPFEIRKEANAKDTAAAPKPAVSNAPKSLLSPEIYSKNFLFWVFLFTFLVLAFVVSATRYAIRSTYQSLLNEGSFRAAFKEQTGWGSFPYIALYVLFWINAAIFVFLLRYHFHSVKTPDYGQFVGFLICVGGVSLVFIIKHSILYLIANIFPIEKPIRQYNFIIIMSGILIGLILAPLNLFIAYAPDSLTDSFIYVAFLGIFATYLLRTLRGLSVGSHFLGNDRFHFFLYLCSVEIAPLAVLIKFILSQMGK